MSVPNSMHLSVKVASSGSTDYAIQVGIAGSLVRQAVHNSTFTDWYQRYGQRPTLYTFRLVSEQQVTSYQRTPYKKTQERLTSLLDSYDRKTVKTSDFLRQVGNLYAIPVPNPEMVESSDSDSD